jgi:hypothetical protein
MELVTHSGFEGVVVACWFWVALLVVVALELESPIVRVLLY